MGTSGGGWNDLQNKAPLIKQTVRVDLHEPRYIEAFGRLPEMVRALLSPYRHIGVLIVVWAGNPITLVVERGWLDLMIDLGTSDPEAVDRLTMPSSVVMVALENWPSVWGQMDWGNPTGSIIADGITLIGPG